MGATLEYDGKQHELTRKGDGLHKTTEFIEAFDLFAVGGGALIRFNYGNETGIFPISAGQKIGPLKLGLDLQEVTIIGT